MTGPRRQRHGEITGSCAGQPRQMRSSFGVTLTGDPLTSIKRAAEAHGVSISAFLREATLALAAAQDRGGTAKCGHLSVSPVTLAECPTCGPLSVTLTVAVPCGESRPAA